MTDDLLVWHVGDVVLKWRGYLKMSRRELAKQTGMHQDTIARIENGQEYRRDNLVKIGNVFGVTPEQMFRDVPVDIPLEVANAQIAQQQNRRTG